MKAYNNITELFKVPFYKWLCENSYDFIFEEITKQDAQTNILYFELDPGNYLYAIGMEYIDIRNIFLLKRYTVYIESLLNQVKDKLNELIASETEVIIPMHNCIQAYGAKVKGIQCLYNNYEQNKPLRPQIQALADCLHMIYGLENKV